jgi:rhodanese-related sulfurtransferase
MKKKHVLFLVFCIVAYGMNAQQSLDELLKQYNSKDVPYISVQELAMPKTKAIILDARESQEYQVSHLKDAIYVGYENFQLDNIAVHVPTKDDAIVVYCSLGIRSEVVAHKLKKAGYTNVKNLYGGIFEWKNKDFEVYNSEDRKTDSIHTFSQAWSKWLNRGIKVYAIETTTDD